MAWWDNGDNGGWDQWWAGMHGPPMPPMMGGPLPPSQWTHAERCRQGVSTVCLRTPFCQILLFDCKAQPRSQQQGDNEEARARSGGHRAYLKFPAHLNHALLV